MSELLSKIEIVVGTSADQSVYGYDSSIPFGYLIGTAHLPDAVYVVTPQAPQPAISVTSANMGEGLLVVGPAGWKTDRSDYLQLYVAVRDRENRVIAQASMTGLSINPGEQGFTPTISSTGWSASDGFGISWSDYLNQRVQVEFWDGAVDGVWIGNPARLQAITDMYDLGRIWNSMDVSQRMKYSNMVGARWAAMPWKSEAVERNARQLVSSAPLNENAYAYAYAMHLRSIVERGIDADEFENTSNAHVLTDLPRVVSNVLYTANGGAVFSSLQIEDNAVSRQPITFSP